MTRSHLFFVVTRGPLIGMIPSLGQVLREMAGKVVRTGLGGPNWNDYPAYALAGPPKGSGIGNKKKGVGPPPPLFDILVEPEYIPDPYPIPYPFPIDVMPSGIPGNMSGVPEGAPHSHPPMTRKPRYKRLQYIERAGVEWTCPKEFYLDGPHCLKIDQLEAMLGCKAGWRYERGLCHAVDLQPPEAVCDEGYQPWVEGQNECVMEVVAPKEMHCPTGYDGFIEGCKRVLETPPLARCSVGTLINNKCVEEVLTKPAASCPHGFALTPDSLSCFRELREAGTVMCPNGPFSLLPSMDCERTMSMNPQVLCPHGFFLNGDQCQQELREHPTYACDEGVMQDEQCVVTVAETQAQFVCPADFPPDPLRAGICSRLVETKATAGCAKGFLLDPEANQCIQRNPTAIKDHKKKGLPTAASGIVSVAPALHCPPHFALSPNLPLCTAMEELPAQIACPDSYTLVEHVCRQTARVPPIAMCPERMGLRGGVCFELLTGAPQLVCQPGFSLRETGDCRMTEIKPSITKCPIGFEVAHPGECRRIEKMDASLSCPPMTILRRNHNQEVPTCEGERIGDPDLICTVAGLTLQKDTSGFTCSGEELIAPLFQCPHTFKEEGGGCVKYEVSPKRSLCPAEYTLSFDTCIRNVEDPPVILCPEGFELQQSDQTCIRRRKTDRIPVCPPDMEYDKLVRECYRMNVDYSFDEAEAPENVPPAEEAQLPMEVQSTSTPAPEYAPPPEPYQPLPLPVPMPVPPPQITIVQQPVVIPQPAVILPQQAPIPPPPAIRVPVGVPEPVPVAKPIKHQHLLQHVHKQHDAIHIG